MALQESDYEFERLRIIECIANLAERIAQDDHGPCATEESAGATIGRTKSYMFRLRRWKQLRGEMRNTYLINYGRLKEFPVVLALKPALIDASVRFEYDVPVAAMQRRESIQIEIE